MYVEAGSVSCDHRRVTTNTPPGRYFNVKGGKVYGHLSPLEVPDQVGVHLADFLGALEGRR
jgi:hypothetical protein